MLLSAVCILACLLFVFCVRKHKKILSAIIAIETLILIFMLAVTYLSAAGCNNVYLFIIARAICSEVSVFGITISSLVVIQSAVVLVASFIFLYGILKIVKIICSKRKDYVKVKPAKKIYIYTPCGFTKRKVFKLYCRMNN